MYNSRIVNIFGRFFSYYLGAFWVVIWALFGLLSGRFLGCYLGAFWAPIWALFGSFLGAFWRFFWRFLGSYLGAFWTLFLALSGRFLGAFLRPNRAGIFYTSLPLLLQGPVGATCWAQYIYSMYTFAEVHIFVHSHRIGQRK